MFTDSAYAIGSGHIIPLIAWQLEKILSEKDVVLQIESILAELAMSGGLLERLRQQGMR